MRYLSILEKLKVLFDLFMSYKFILIITILMLIFTILFVIKKINGKKYIVSMFVSLCIAFIISIVNNHKILANTFDNFTTIFFNGIYFPSIYVYLVILLIVLISFIVSILNKNANKAYKITNSITFIINNILFVIILNVIASNKIDIFSVSSLYTSSSLVSILELNMGLFILWIFSIIVIYVTNAICSRISLKKSVTIENKVEEIVKPKEELTFNDILNNIVVTYYNNDNINNNNNEYELSNPQEIYEDNYNKVVNASIEKKEETNQIENNIEIKEKVNEIENDLSLNDLIKEDKEIKTIENVINTINNDSYTLNDYKKMVEMLKQIQSDSNKNNISIDDAVTMSLINNYSIDDCVKFKELLESNLN